MASMMKLCFSVIFSCLLCNCLAQDIFKAVLGDTQSCSSVCQNTYTPHTYDKALHMTYCRRGCRLFSIIDFVHKGDDINKTRDCCASSCKEAYKSADDAGACILGCNSQVSTALKRQHESMQTSPNIHLVYPFMYVHKMYSNMFHNIRRSFSVSWSYYKQGDDGRVVVVRSDPQIITEFDGSPVPDYKTSNYLESNLAAVDNSATPNVKNSQMNSLERSLDDMNYASAEGQNQDWLSCISHKTGLSRLFLSFTLFLSAMVMIWLCFTTAATAPDHHIKQQKLSIYGDLDYLNEVKDKGLYGMHPQEKMVYASPLPVKIKVDTV